MKPKLAHRSHSDLLRHRIDVLHDSMLSHLQTQKPELIATIKYSELRTAKGKPRASKIVAEGMIVLGWQTVPRSSRYLFLFVDGLFYLEAPVPAVDDMWVPSGIVVPHHHEFGVFLGNGAPSNHVEPPGELRVFGVRLMRAR